MNASARMIMELNIKHYRDLLKTETDASKRRIISKLLAEEEAKLPAQEDQLLAGHQGLLRRDEVAATYAALTGHTPRDLDWYTAYAAVRHAIIMTRVGLRQVHFGEAEMPADLDDLVTHRASLAAMLDGTYWDAVPR